MKLMRVPLDFNWPLDKIWDGYLNPYLDQTIECVACEGSGFAPEAKRMTDEWYGLAPFDPVAYGAKSLTVEHPSIVDLAKRNVERGPDHYGSIVRETRRLFEIFSGQWCHHLIQADVDALVAADRLRRGRLEGFGSKPTADKVNAWSIQGFGHDTINQHVCVEARCKREGHEFLCPQCAGEATVWPNAETKRLCEEWHGTDPPKGEGWQLWETVSEGSPVSKVYPTMETFVTYLRSQGYSKKAAENFCRDGWAASTVIDQNGTLYKNIHSAELHKP